MIYHLLDYLTQFDFTGGRLFQYVTTRSIAAFVLSLLIATIIGRHIIDHLRKRQIGDTVRDLGIEGQMKKQGTPTMGGIIIIIAILVPTLLLAKLTNIYVILMIITTVMMGILGFIDDYIKKFRNDKDGLKAKYKIIGQVFLGVIIAFTFYFSQQTGIHENIEVVREGHKKEIKFSPTEAKSTKTTIPFVKNNNFDYQEIIPFKGKMKSIIGWGLFIVVAILIVTFISNCVNLTDGIDGLAAGLTAPVGVGLGLLAYVSSHIQLASYLNIMFIPGAEELTIFASAMVGATFGFLWYNAYPAQVFMGDTGSLTLGGIIAVFAILIRKEFLLPLLCGVFIAEGISVMLQVAYFKYSKKRYNEGRRIFKMTPLHHHFQKPGDGSIKALIQKPFHPMPESRLTMRFWLIGIILVVLAIGTLKMR